MLYVLGHTNVESIAQLAISISNDKGRPLGHGLRKKTCSRSTQLIHLLIEHVAIRGVDATPVVMFGWNEVPNVSYIMVFSLWMVFYISF